ncbi:F-box/kelch-repeat protein At1g23390-like [Corylus avellana]|uniref:F-box/kelch-repeat protein At1g23390-like n=1 Tax=Corylus avellana TaxID=13451 RepID=UPI001E235F86|nr:F-box/kelch-repeat protein At1g23390-like [Corylus avellana]
MAEEEKEAPLHADILEAILSHVPLIDLAPASRVSGTWKRAVLSSLERFNKIKPWLVVHTKSSRHPYKEATHAYDPRSHVWVEIQQPTMEHVPALRSSHSTLLYILSPCRFTFSVDPFHLMWHTADSPIVWRSDPVVALVGHRAVVAGGMCDFGDEPIPMEIYDLSTRKWDVCNSIPAILVDTAASTCLSVAVDECRMYVMEKSSGVTYFFEPSSKTWRGPYDMQPDKKAFSSLIGFINDRMVVVGLIGDAENVNGVKMWEVKGEMSELREMGKMPKELVGKLKGESPRVSSIGMTSMGDVAYFHNSSDPVELILCEVSKGVCKWGSVRNVVVKDGGGMQSFVFTCSNVGIVDLHEALRSGYMRFAIKDVA